jgi:hypothetical protein
MAVRGWAGQYIGDGMMIAAAIGMNLEFETRDFDSNVAIVLRVRSERRAA